MDYKFDLDDIANRQNIFLAQGEIHIKYINSLRETMEQRAQGPISLSLNGVAKSVIFI